MLSKSNRKKIVVILSFIFVCPHQIHAEETPDYIPLDITVPTETSIKFNEDGSNTIPSNFTIINNSSIGGIKIKSIRMDDHNDWKLIPLSVDQTKFPANSKQVKMQISSDVSKTYDLSSKINNIQDMLINPLSSLDVKLDVWRAAYSFENKQKAFDMIFTIDWQKEPAIIKFDSDGGSIIDKIITVNDTLDLTKYNPTKDNYTFLGWYDSMDPDQQLLLEKLPIFGNMVLKAKWQINQHTISFDTAGGSLVDAITQDYGSTINLDSLIPTRKGYSFDGWYIDGQKLNGDYYIEHNQLLTARWLANEYTLSFDSAGGSSVDSKKVIYDQLVGDITLPSKKSWYCDGWLLDGVYIDSSTQYTFDHDSTAVAQWSNLPPRIISFPAITNSLQEIVVDGKWYMVYRSLVIDDREDGIFTSSNNYMDFSFSADTAKILEAGLHVAQIISPSGEVRGDGIHNAYLIISESMEAFIQRGGKGTYKVRYRTVDSLGEQTFFERDWILN